jgi:hypothetical protein
MTDPKTIPDLISNNYSGIIKNQNTADNSVSATAGAATTVIQEFKLPSDYKRGSYIPDLTGFQIRVECPTDPVTNKLQTQILSTGTAPTTIDLDHATDWPSSGTLIINDEIFTYTGKNGNTQLTGVQAAQLGTNRSNHIVNSKVSLLLATYKLEHIVNASQKVDILGTPTDGTFTLTYNSQTTSALSYDSAHNPPSASVVETALANLSTIGSGNVQVAREDTSSGASYYIKFVGQLAGTSISTLTANGTGLTGGTTPSIVVTVLQASDVTLVNGNQTQISVADNNIGWFAIKFKSITIDPDWLLNKFRLTVTFCPNVVNRVFCTSPNAILSGSINGTSKYLTHRILASTADSGKDFLTNDYKSVVVKKEISSINTNNKNSNYWMSKPNPSEFAVENLYFNMGSEKVIDSIYLDPITPNVYFNVYYSNDVTGPGHDDDSWDDLSWTHVRKTFKATKKDIYVFPEPVSAKYIKVEFSHLQANYYPVGTFQKPILYKKHPKWVLDYFLTVYTFDRNKTYDINIGSSTTLTYDALDLAFNYYKDDIFTNPNGPIVTGLANLSNTQIQNTLLDVTDYSNLGWNTLNKIKIMFKPYQGVPANMSSTDDLIGKLALARVGSDANIYPVENATGATANTGEVSVLDREALLLEKNFPLMFFYITCRHFYKEALAQFKDDRAYFAGANEIAFQRDVHSVSFDAVLYNESTNDLANSEINDFNTNGSNWTVS